MIHGGIDPAFWRGRRVLVTGHTGFKGAWLTLWLQQLGAQVVGYALAPQGERPLFEALRLTGGMAHFIGDIRDQAAMQDVMQTHQVEVVLHLAAQALVRPSYQDPIETYDVNVMGSLKVMEAVRRSPSVRAVVMVTTDKCYANREWCWAYRETDPLGGHDPYSASKGAMEIVVDSHRQSFFAPALHSQHGVALATVRAGNVIGGGDWSEDRLVPDLMRAFRAGLPALIRNARAVRPWQHVLQPLQGYLMLAERLHQQGPIWGEAWNFGPGEDDCQAVGVLADLAARVWGEGAGLCDETQPDAPHEAGLLKLDSAKARSRLGWRPLGDLSQAVTETVAWYRAQHHGQDVRALSLAQIAQAQHGGRSHHAL